MLAVVFLATSLAPNYLVALGIVAALGASSIVFKALSSTWLQLTAAPAMRGRVLALLVVSIGGTTPIGAPLMGWVAEEFGTRATFVLAGVCTAIAAALAHLYMRRATAQQGVRRHRARATTHHQHRRRRRVSLLPRRPSRIEMPRIEIACLTRIARRPTMAGAVLGSVSREAPS